MSAYYRFLTLNNDREAWGYPVKTGGILTNKASKVSGAAALGGSFILIVKPCICCTISFGIRNFRLQLKMRHSFYILMPQQNIFLEQFNDLSMKLAN